MFGLPGGAQKAGVTITTTAINLTELAGYDVDIWSDDQDILVGWSADGLESLTYSGDLAASKTAAKARRVARGCPYLRRVWIRYPYLLVATVAGTALVHVAVVSDKLGH
jgi:hypothetical protein